MAIFDGAICSFDALQRTPNEYRHNPYINERYLNLQLGARPSLLPFPLLSLPPSPFYSFPSPFLSPFPPRPLFPLPLPPSFSLLSFPRSSPSFPYSPLLFP